MPPSTGSRLCSRCRQRPASGKHAWCTRCKKGRGGPPSLEARQRRRRRNLPPIVPAPETVATVVDVVDASRKAEEQGANGNERQAANAVLEAPDGDPACVDACAAVTMLGAVDDAATSVLDWANGVVSDTRAKAQADEASAIPPARARESFPPREVGFVALLRNPKKTDASANGQEVNAHERCPTPNVRRVSPRVALCFSCSRRDLADRLFDDHERGDTALCDSAELEPFAGGQLTRCRRCGSAGLPSCQRSPNNPHLGSSKIPHPSCPRRACT
jgi:hypothetical protein